MANPRGNPNIVEAGKGTRFGSGQVNNPGGRPKGVSLTATLRALLDQPCVEGSPVTNREMIAAMLVKLATGGELPAIREVFDRTEGKAVQTINLETRDAIRQLAEQRGLDPDKVVSIYEGLSKRRVG